MTTWCALNGIKFLMDETEKDYPVKYKSDKANLYAWYYNTQACLMVGGAAWNTWNRLFQDQIVKNQSPDGSWPLHGRGEQWAISNWGRTATAPITGRISASSCSRFTTGTCRRPSRVKRTGGKTFPISGWRRFPLVVVSFPALPYRVQWPAESRTTGGHVSMARP